MTRTLATGALFLSFAACIAIVACGASMRPIPDDVEPVPKTSQLGSKSGAMPSADAGRTIALADAASHTLAHNGDNALVGCLDNRHRPLRVQRVASDSWVIARGVLDALRNERKAQFSPMFDQAGNVSGATLDSVSESCLAVLGFQAGDVLRSINGVAADWNQWGPIYQSIIKDGNAVVRFERAGHALTVVYEIRNE